MASRSLLFVFDMDGVIYDYDWRVRVADLVERTGRSVEEMRGAWWEVGREHQAEAGHHADGAAYLAAMNEAFGAALTVEDFVANRRAAMTVRPGVVAAVARAAELGQVSLLTNNGALVAERLAELAHEIAELFGEHLRASCFYGARKPDPRVFEKVLASYERAPSEVFFTDDLVENVESARSLGIAGHLYQDPDALRAAIETFAHPSRR